MYVNYFPTKLEEKFGSHPIPLWCKETLSSHTRCFSPKFDHALRLLHIPKALGFGNKLQKLLIFSTFHSVTFISETMNTLSSLLEWREGKTLNTKI